MTKQYITIDRLKIVEMEEAALRKAMANSGRPLSEASIEARAVLQVVNYLYENDEKIEQDIKKYPCVNHDAASWDEEETNKRMDIIGQNGNEGIHYVTNEEADEDATGKHIQSRSNK